MENYTDLPWVEKYRPKDLNGIISHTNILNTLQNLINNNKLPHLIFYGPPGTGKTTTILACGANCVISYPVCNNDNLFPNTRRKSQF
jgi:DNA polymerase III gamma/tau subunit